jgi:hypothetical protein
MNSKTCLTTSTDQSEVGWKKITDVNQEEEDPPIDITIKSTAYLAYLSIIY